MHAGLISSHHGVIGGAHFSSGRTYYLCLRCKNLQDSNMNDVGLVVEDGGLKYLVAEGGNCLAYLGT